MHTPFDDIDLPEFVIDSGAIIGGTFVMSGWVERGIHHEHRGHSFGRHAIDVRVPHALTFTIEDCTDTGILVVGSLSGTATEVRLDGQTACAVRIETSEPSAAEFHVNETPSFLNRRAGVAASSR